MHQKSNCLHMHVAQMGAKLQIRTVCIVQLPLASAPVYMSAPGLNCIVVSSCQLTTGHGQQKNPAHREGNTKRANSRTCYILWRINGTYWRASVAAAMTQSEQNQSGFTTGYFLAGRRTVSAVHHLSGSLGAKTCQSCFCNKPLLRPPTDCC